jgi:hypothetical protein
VNLRHIAAPLVLLVAAGASACDAITSVVASGADFGGTTADVHCDRRVVADGGQPSAFCQELVATVAASQFADDCRNKFQATAATGLCPRTQVIAGCQLGAKNDDGSKVWDWYYDVSGVIGDAGEHAGPDGGPTFADPVPLDASAVGSVCADRKRYDQGAELVFP